MPPINKRWIDTSLGIANVTKLPNYKWEVRFSEKVIYITARNWRWFPIKLMEYLHSKNQCITGFFQVGHNNDKDSDTFYHSRFRENKGK